MSKPKKNLEERIADADDRAARYLGNANEAEENGNMRKAEQLIEKCQYWLDMSNKLRGFGE